MRAKALLVLACLTCTLAGGAPSAADPGEQSARRSCPGGVANEERFFYDSLRATDILCRNAERKAIEYYRSKGKADPGNFRCHSPDGDYRLSGLCRDRDRPGGRWFYFLIPE